MADRIAEAIAGHNHESAIASASHRLLHLAAAADTRIRRALMRLVPGRQRQPLPIVATKRRLRVLPNAGGWLVVIMVVCVLLQSLLCTSIPGMVWGLFALSCLAAALIFTRNNLRGARIVRITNLPAHAGQDLHVDIIFGDEASGRRRHGVALVCAGHRAVGDVWHGSTIRLRLPGIPRGEHVLPDLVVETTQPFGWARAWMRTRPQASVLVYPALEVGGPSWQSHAGDGPGHRGPGNEDMAFLRSWRDGDALNRVDWKSSARHAVRLVRESEDGGNEVWFEWDRLAGLDAEARIRRLARWVGEAQAAGRRYGMRLPGRTLGPDSGQAWLRECWTALARLPAGMPT